MSEDDGYLVVGGDSLVGGETFRALTNRGHQAFATTRRSNTVDTRRVFLDFESDDPFRAPEGIQYAYVIAAATNYERCVRDPLARVINIELIPRLVGSLLEQGIFVSFISSNSVFGGERPWPHEDDPHAPGIAYAQQKSEGEKAIRSVAQGLNASDRINIVRLTKILNCDVPPLPAWVEAWREGKIVEPFSDLVFAPLSAKFVAESLAVIGERRIPGNLHLSGAANVTYVEFAYALAQRLNAATRLIEPTTAVAKGINIPFKPTYSGLGMARTTKLTGIEPQPLADLVDDLSEQLADRTKDR
jgi:dTDP-4-dehydrorhamnose reductase